MNTPKKKKQETWSITILDGLYCFSTEKEYLIAQKMCKKYPIAFQICLAKVMYWDRFLDDAMEGKPHEFFKELNKIKNHEGIMFLGKTDKDGKKL